MEILKTTGFVLRLHPVTETSLIVTWFTSDHGKLRTMAKGARRPKSPFRGSVEPFYFDELLFLRSRRTDQDDRECEAVAALGVHSEPKAQCCAMNSACVGIASTHAEMTRCVSARKARTSSMGRRSAKGW